MIGLTLIAAAVLVFAVLLLQPKIGTVLVWPIVFAYPHLYVERLELMPWNVGMDDVFICIFFLAVVVRRGFFGKTPLRFGLAMWGALTYFLIWTTSNLSGWSIMPEALPVEIVKPILKCLIFVLFTYAMVHTIDSERDLRMAGLAFLVGIALGGVTVILHQTFPHQMFIFTSEAVEIRRRALGGVERAVGAWSSANIGCALLGMAVLFGLSLSRTRTTARGKGLVFGCIVILLAAMLLTESRSGAAALTAALVAMAFLSRAKVYAWVVVAGIVAVVLARPYIFLDFWNRIVSAYNPEAGGQFGVNVQTRVDLWRIYWEASTPQIWLLGQGRFVPAVQHGFHTHSTYLASLFNFGIGGVIWLMIFFGLIVRRAMRMVRADIEPYRAIASGVLWSLLAYAVAGFALDLLGTLTPRFVFLFYAVLIERSWALMRETGLANISAQTIPSPVSAARGQLVT